LIVIEVRAARTARRWHRRHAARHAIRLPYQPSVHDLHQNGRQFPPNYLHERWMDYLYWDSVLEP